jgi:hypothetical protein
VILSPAAHEFPENRFFCLLRAAPRGVAALQNWQALTEGSKNIENFFGKIHKKLLTKQQKHGKISYYPHTGQ